MRCARVSILASMLVLSLASVAVAQTITPRSRHATSPPPQSAPDRNLPSTLQLGTEAAPVTVKIVPAVKTAEEKATELGQQQDQSASSWWLVRLTAILALLGGLQTVVFGIQAWHLKQTIEEMDKIAKDQRVDINASIDQAKRSADAAFKSAQTAERGLRLLNRPWLDTDQWRATLTNEAGSDVVRVLFNIVNPSRTPARIRHIHVLVIKNGPGLGQTNPESINHILTPGSHYPYSITIPSLSDEDAEALADGKFILIIQGTIYFDDLFRQTNIKADGDERWGARKRQFGRRCVLTANPGYPNLFDMVQGSEGVGMNDEDWSEEDQKDASALTFV